MEWSLSFFKIILPYPWGFSDSKHVIVKSFLEIDLIRLLIVSNFNNGVSPNIIIIPSLSDKL